MQISDLFGQYNRNVGQNVTAANIVQADKVGTLLSTASKLKVGAIFEGNITQIKGGNVLLSLSNGQTLNARLDNSIKMVQGQSMFFQVKSNDGSTIAIRPYIGGNTDNPILKSALETAGIPINERTADMVNTMMKERMSIDANALAEMYKTVGNLENVSVDTAVSMTKLGLPITPENASQFENYVNDSGEILKQMEDFFQELPEFLSSDEFSAPTAIGVNHELLSIITEGMPDEVVIMPEEMAAGQETQEAALMEGEVPVPEQAAENESVPGGAEGAAELSQGAVEPQTESAAEAGGQPGAQGVRIEISQGETYAPNQLGEIFRDEEELEHLADNLRMIGDLSDNDMLFDQEGNLNKNLTAKQILSIIDTELLQSASSTEKEDVTHLFKSKEYRNLLQNVMEEQWMLKPEDVRDKESVKGLYDKLDKQLQQIEKLTNLTGQDTSSLSHAANEIRDNMNFINDVNQFFTYTQIPLKMSGQNANGDLYVYTNKKALQDPDGELSAFLHLDMDHLGSTDVSVKMHKKNVKTDFFMKDDVSFQLLQEHMPILKERLDALGFSVEISVSNEEKPVNFVKDFLEKDMAPAKEMVHRYSFDVRA